MIKTSIFFDALINCPLGDVTVISNMQISNKHNGMRYGSGKSRSYSMKYTLIMPFDIYYRIRISVSFILIFTSQIIFKLTWVRCISFSYIDTILNFMCINFLPVPQPLTQARISQIYNLENILIKNPIVFGSN